MRYLRPIDDLPPLPKNSRSYLTLLMELLQWIKAFHDRKEKASYYLYRAWVYDHFAVVETRAKDYQQLATRLGLITTRLGEYLLTEFGARVLESSPEERIRLLVQQVMRRVTDADLILAVFATINEPVSLEELDAELTSIGHLLLVGRDAVLRASFLEALGCLQEVGEETYRITEYGHTVVEQFYPEAPRPYYAQEIESRPSMPEYEIIARELFLASRDSDHHQRLEDALARAFQFLGFRVVLSGKPGETDVIAYADMGSAGYAAIIDAKARKSRVLNTLEPETLHKHQQKHKADYVIVISEGFYNPIVRVAEANNIVLITLATLADWLKLHQYTPRSMETYRAFFQQAGQVASVPHSVLRAKADFERMVALLNRTVELMAETNQRGLKASMTVDNVFFMLFSRYPADEYKKEEVEAICAFLANPVVSGIESKEDQQMHLISTKATLADILHRFATGIATS